MDDVADDVTSNTFLEPGINRGRLDSGDDVDVWRFSAEAGLTYGVIVGGDGTASAITSVSPRFIDSLGNRFERFPDNGARVAIDITAESDDDGLLAVRYVTDFSNDPGNYVIEYIDTDEVRGDVLSETDLETGLNAGRIDTQFDRDVYRFEVQDGLTYRLFVSGDGSSAELDQIRLTVRDQLGNPLETTTSFRDTQTLEFVADSDATRYLEISNGETVSFGRFDEVGNFVIDFNNSDTIPATTSTTALVDFGDGVASAIDVSSDVDWFRFEGVVGEQFEFTARGEVGSDPLSAPALLLFDGLGNLQFGGSLDTATGTAELSAEVTGSGTFFIGVTGRTSDPTGAYRLSATINGARTGEGLSIEAAQTVAYLYEAGLNRDGNIDLPGLNFWINQREAGLSEQALARAFLESGEFEAAFGEAFDTSDPDYLSNQALVEQLYRNVLNREGETAGVDFWTGLVASPEFTRADLLLAFAGSPENVAGSPFVDDLAETSPGEWAFLG